MLTALVLAWWSGEQGLGSGVILHQVVMMQVASHTKLALLPESSSLLDSEDNAMITIIFEQSQELRSDVNNFVTDDVASNKEAQSSIKFCIWYCNILFCHFFSVLEGLHTKSE